MRDNFINWLDRNAQELVLVFAFVLCSALYSFGQEKNEHQGVYDMIVAHNIQHPEIVFHQALLESGNFSPDIKSSWNCCNNAFGFYNGERYLKYDNLEHCIEGYKAWQEWKCPDCKTAEEYKQCLLKEWKAPNMKQYIINLEKFEE